MHHEQRGQQLTLGQVTGGAEYHQRRWFRQPPEIDPLTKGILGKNQFGHVPSLAGRWDTFCQSSRRTSNAILPEKRGALLVYSDVERLEGIREGEDSLRFELGGDVRHADPFGFEGGQARAGLLHS